MVTDPIRTLIMKKTDAGTIRKKAVELGMLSFREHGIEKVFKGITTIEEVLTNTQLDQ